MSLVGCKTTQTTTAVSEPKTAYREDLSSWRPEIKQMDTTIVTEAATEPAGHLKMELDSISNMLVRQNAKPRMEQGYTIQIYNGRSRNDATKALGKIRVAFPDLDSNITYFQPDFKVKSGKFLNRITAYETFEKVKDQFAEAILIPEKIKVNYD